MSSPVSDEITQYKVMPFCGSSLNLISSYAGTKSLSCSTHLNNFDFLSKSELQTSLNQILRGLFVRSLSLLEHVVLRVLSPSREGCQVCSTLVPSILHHNPLYTSRLHTAVVLLRSSPPNIGVTSLLYLLADIMFYICLYNGIYV